MTKKIKAQAIWQSGVDAFAARRKKVEELRAAVRSARAVPVRSGPRLVEPEGRMSDEHIRRALLTATLPLRQELEALKQEVAELRAQVAELSKRR